jgi:hypothetical protein
MSIGRTMIRNLMQLMTDVGASINRLAAGNPSPEQGDFRGEEWDAHLVPHVGRDSRAVVAEGHEARPIGRSVSGLS